LGKGTELDPDHDSAYWIPDGAIEPWVVTVTEPGVCEVTYDNGDGTGPDLIKIIEVW
jgi:hypothetical protein